jgi:hypothetical protein
MTATLAQSPSAAAGTGYVVGDYLLDRLAELGVEHMSGVPGDYTLGLLDHVLAHPRVEWVDTTNEPNAAYAADGYGRRAARHHVGTAARGPAGGACRRRSLVGRDYVPGYAGQRAAAVGTCATRR